MTVFEGKDEIILYCNFTKSIEENYTLMLLLNEGNQIIIKNINPKEEEGNPTDKEKDKDETSDDNKNDDENKILKYFYYIGLPIIAIILIAIIIILIIKNCRKNKNTIEDLPTPLSSLLKELNNI